MGGVKDLRVGVGQDYGWLKIIIIIKTYIGIIKACPAFLMCFLFSLLVAQDKVRETKSCVCSVSEREKEKEMKKKIL